MSCSLVVGTFSKTVPETYLVGVDYTDSKANDAELLGATVEAIRQSDGSDATNDVLASPTAIIRGDTAEIRVQAGDVGETYDLTFSAPFSIGDLLQDVIVMQVV